ncbi:MAG TPA: aldo/keto reductase [Candidatus Sulfotelmatobacter sp.]|nr:aldo/keto reductase [Candidatus Sulfotelmatobacter sp.]
MNPVEQVRLGRTSVILTRLGLGTAPLGGLFRPTAESEAAETLAQAYALGIRYFDTAPLYGYGLAEARVGRALGAKPRDSFVVSTKVGRLLRPDAPPDPSQYHGGEPFYKGTPPVNPVFDFSYDGVMRSLEESLARLQLDRVDLLYIHDPDRHHQQALEGAYRALDALRAAGTVGAIGVGMNRWEPLARFAREARFDVFMLAGRYTLLDQSAFPELLPLCAAEGIRIVAAGVYNSGILADPRTKARFNYVPAPAVLVERALRLEAVCRRWGVPLRAAAAQFPFSHPAVISVVLGSRAAADIAENAALLQLPIPPALWQDLAGEGLLPAGVAPRR